MNILTIVLNQKTLKKIQILFGCNPIAFHFIFYTPTDKITETLVQSKIEIQKYLDIDYINVLAKLFQSLPNCFWAIFWMHMHIED